MSTRTVIRLTKPPKNQYCSKCGSLLTVERGERYVYPGDSEFSRRQGKGINPFITENKIIDYHYYCPECGNCVSVSEQSEIARVQKTLGKIKFSQEEFDAFIHSPQNLNYLNAQKKKYLKLFISFLILSLIAFALMIVAYGRGYNVAGLICFVPLIILSNFVNSFKGSYKWHKEQLSKIINPLNELEERLNKQKSNAIKHLIKLVCTLVFIGIILIALILLKGTVDKVAMIFIGVIVGIVALGYLCFSVYDFVIAWIDYLQFKKDVKEYNERINGCED